jgi:hypothetical protein
MRQRFSWPLQTAEQLQPFSCLKERRESKPHPQWSKAKKAQRFKNGAERLRLSEWVQNRRLRRLARNSRSAIVAVASERVSYFVVLWTNPVFRRFRRLNGYPQKVRASSTEFDIDVALIK